MEKLTNDYSQSPGASWGTGHLHMVDVVCHLCEKACKGGRGLQVHLRTCMKRSSPAVATVSTSSVKDRRSAMAPADVSCTQPPVADKRRRNSSGESATSAEEPGVRSPRFSTKRARTARGKRRSNPTGETLQWRIRLVNLSTIHLSPVVRTMPAHWIVARRLLFVCRAVSRRPEYQISLRRWTSHMLMPTGVTVTRWLSSAGG